jgi:sec-independent protein translocase protein TatA
MGLPNIGPLELIIILAIALLIVGPGRLPEMGNAIGRTIREFRNASSDMVDATKVDAEPKPATPAPATPAPAPAAPPAEAAVAVAAEPAPVEPTAPNTLSDEATPNTLAATPAATADAASQAKTDGKDDA